MSKNQPANQPYQLGGIYFFYHIYQPLRSGKIWHKVNF